MEAASLVFSVAQTLLAALQCKELREICSLWGYESELESLQNTVGTIKSVLLDAEAKDVLSHQQLNYVEKLKAVVYDADDLLDEFTALAEQQQHLMQGSKVPNKVRLLFSRFGKLGDFRKLSKGVKKIRKELDGIATDASKYSFKVDYEPIRRRREDTCSYVHEKDVIGREKETEEIINMLLPPHADTDVVQGDLSVLAIVGMGGLGKTTLAQLLYQHEKVITEFQLRLWACVSDQDKEQLALHPILASILESATEKKHDGSGIELVQRQLREVLQGKKYLLVLDDVWTEDRNQWLELEKFLKAGGRGSQVLVTTRSESTAKVVGSLTPYKLQGLSEENSRRLFERIAFEEQGRRECHELADIGKDIVKKCANVPLSIRVVGSLLYGQGKEKWIEFKQHGLAVLRHHENPITRILKLSYLHLHPSLKSCFSYCAIFPKDFVIKKETLISLWMAQGYVEPLLGIQSIEDACEEYFMILLRRCFFQDVVKDEFGEIVSCKMHDLMHDMAQEVAGKEICTMDSTSRLDRRIHHVSHSVRDCPESLFTGIGIRSFLGIDKWWWVNMDARLPMSILLAKWKRLRVLDFRCLGLRCLPEAIGNLLHLRYLDVSFNYELEKLPDSITKLHYLQTLRIRGCNGVKNLPKNFSKLVKLRLLDVENRGLSSMPSGMGKLTCLCRLSTFVVSERNSRSQQDVSNLEDLRAVRDLKGQLVVKIKGGYKYVKEGSRDGGFLRNKKRLNDIQIVYEGRVDGEEELLEDLQPYDDVKSLSLSGYGGVRIPTWAKEENLKTFLPKLVRICLRKCKGLQELPCLGGLQHLKFIKLDQLQNLEYMENRITSEGRSVAEPFFPSLEKLELIRLPNVKEWSKGSTTGMVSFPSLSKLTIEKCPNLTSIPLCPTVEILTLKCFNERLRIMREEKEVVLGALSSSVDTSALSLLPPLLWSCGNERDCKLRKVDIDNATYLKILPMAAFRHLKEMLIMNDKEMERLSEVREVLYSCSSTLGSFELSNLPKLTSLSGGGLEHLTALEKLQLAYLPSLSLVDEEEGVPWRCLHRNLRYLYLIKLPKVEALPVSMQQLTSLTRLDIWSCSERLQQRCQSPDGEDWPLIQHIPYIDNMP